jgi:exonuclease VII large subunit
MYTSCSPPCTPHVQSHHALEHRLDREAEGLEGLLDRTARDLARSLDGKLQASMKEAVDALATELQAELGALKGQQARTEGDMKEQKLRVETQRQGLEHKIRSAQHQVEESEARVNVSLKRLQDEIQHNTQTYGARFDALDEQLHAARALAGQHKVESVERDTQLDVKLRRLEQELLFAGGVGHAQSALRLLDVAQPLDLLAPTPSPLPFEEGAAVGGDAGATQERTTQGAAASLGTSRAAATGGAGGIIGSMQGEMEAFRRYVMEELQGLHQKLADGSERMSDTRHQLSETESRLGARNDTVWEETRQQWEAVSKRLQEESKALQEQLAMQRKVEQEHRDELDAAIRLEAETRAAASVAATQALEVRRLEGGGLGL